MSKPIYVTQPDLPPLNDFLPYLQKIWDSKILTNGGPFHQQLEKELCDYLGVKEGLNNSLPIGVASCLFSDHGVSR
jgi:dTDP-4-amino-4,6-dideoxygalactose transaminase